MATLTLNSVTRAGQAATLVAAAGGGDAMACGPANWLEVNNGGGSPINVTLTVPASIQNQGEVISNRVVSVAAGARARIGPVLASLYQDPTTGLCTITYSGVTSVTVGAFGMNAGT